MGGGGGKTTIKLDANGMNPEGTTFSWTVSTIFKGFMGAGALSLPLLFKEGGVIATSIFLWVLGCIALYAIFSLVNLSTLIILTDQRKKMITRIKRKTDPHASRAKWFEIIPGVTDADMILEDKNVDVPSFSECGNVAIGPIGGYLVEAALAICQLGICIAYVIFVSTNLYESIGLISRVWWIIAMTATVGLLLLIPDLKKLSFVGVIGNIVYLVTVGVIVYVGYTNFCCIARQDIVWNNVSAYGAIFGTCSFALEGIAIILPIRSGMKDTNQFAGVMNLSMFLVVGVYWAFGLGSYLLFGEHTQSPIISSLPPTTLAKIAKIALSLSIFFSFPLQFFPIREFIVNTLSKMYKVDDFSLQKSHDIIKLVGENIQNHENHENHGGNHSLIHLHDIDENYEYSNDNTNDDDDDDDNGGANRIKLHIDSSEHTFDHQDKVRYNNNREDSMPSMPSMPSTPTTPFTASSLQTLQLTDPDYDSYHKSHQAIHNAQLRVYSLSIFFRFLILALISFIGIVFPDFKLIVALFGSFANSSLAYIFPTIFWIFTIAYGRRYIMNSPKYIELAKSTHIFQISTILHFDRRGKKLHIDEILDKNVEILAEYTRTQIIESLTAYQSPLQTEVSPLTTPLGSRSNSYGSFKEDDFDSGGNGGNGGTSPLKALSPINAKGKNGALRTSDESSTIDLYDNHSIRVGDDLDDLNSLSHGDKNGNKIATRINQSVSIQTVRKVYDRDVNGMEIAPMVGASFAFGWVAFPAVVAVVGIIASAIGVQESMTEIIHKLFP